MKFDRGYTLKEIAEILNADFEGSPEFIISGINEIHMVGPGDLTFVDHPKYYDKVAMHFHFYGADLNQKKLQRSVDLSIEKYCGVMEMFRQFSELKIETHFHNK